VSTPSGSTVSTPTTCSPVNVCDSTQTEDDGPSTIAYLFGKLSAAVKLQVLSTLLSTYMASEVCVSVPDDFLSHAANAMVNLSNSRRTNVLYNLAKGIGSLRVDGTPRFPTDHMPMGLIEYMASFYACDDINQVVT